MNNRYVFRAVVLGVLAAAIAAAIGFGAYNAGVAQGIAQGGQAIASPPAGAQYVYVRPWGFGFHFFPFFGLLFLFFVLRSLFWGGPWRRGWGCGYGYYGAPPSLDEWHRRAHGQQPPPAPPTGTTA